MYVFGAALVMGGVIFVHECGHLIASLLFGVKVRQFLMGFGPALWQKNCKLPGGFQSLKISIRPIWLGGGVDIEESEFLRLPRAKQIFTLLAGPIANLLAAWLAIVISGSMLVALAVRSFVDAFRGALMAGAEGAKLIGRTTVVSLHEVGRLAGGDIGGISGPVGLVAASREAPASFVFWLSVFVGLNIGIGVFNLLPIPPLDGGRILTLFLPAKVRKGVTLLGLGILLGLATAVMVKDIMGLIS
ncbi:MAG: site-2 protease family protein [Candidatus Hadarchaeum sp.]